MEFSKISIYLILIALFVTLSGCGNNPYSANEINFFSISDCPDFIDGAEAVDWARNVGVADDGTSTPSKFFDYGESFGLRCFYWAQDQGGSYSFSSDAGEMWGDYSLIYEMEVQRFTDVELYDSEYYNAKDLVGDLGYCKDFPEATGQSLDPITGLESDVKILSSERYLCSWPAQKLSSGGESINTLSILDLLYFEDSLVTLRIVKEVGTSQNRLDYHDKTGEELQAMGLALSNELFYSSSFQELPVDYEKAILQHLVDTLNVQLEKEDVFYAEEYEAIGL